MADYTEKLTDAKAMGFIDQVGDVFKGLPHLPTNIVEILVKIAPWLALLGGVLGLLAGPIVGVLGSLGSVLSLSPYYLFITIVVTVVTLANAILLLLAFSPLKAKAMRGWVFLFWAQMLSAVDIVLSLLQGQTGSLVGGVIGIAIGLYILFEIRSSYAGSPKTKTE